MSSPIVPGATAFGRFLVEREVGRGATGTCFLAATADGPVLLKVLHATSIVDRSRAKRELSRTTSVAHARVARVLEVGEAEQQAFVVREWVEGESLAAMLERGAIPLARLAALLRDVADGLGEIHKKGLVHREVKPGHVIVGADGAKIIDAAWPSGDSDYTPPEAPGAKLLTLRADLWGLGVLTVHALSGDPPSRGGALPPGLPAPLVTIVGQMLSTDPNQRPFGTRQVAKVCETILGGPAPAKAPKPSLFATSTARGPATAPKAAAPSPPPVPAARPKLSEESLSLRPNEPAAFEEFEEPSGLITLPDSSVSPMPVPGTPPPMGGVGEDEIVEPSGLQELPDQTGAQPLPPRPRAATLLGVSVEAAGLRRDKAMGVLGLGAAAPAPPPASPVIETSPYAHEPVSTGPAGHSFALPDGIVAAQDEYARPVPATAAPVQPPISPFRPLVDPVEVPVDVRAETLPAFDDLEAAAARFESESIAPPTGATRTEAGEPIEYERDSGATPTPGLRERFFALPPRMRVGIGAGAAGILLLVLVVVLSGGDDTDEAAASSGEATTAIATGSPELASAPPPTTVATSAPLPATAAPAAETVAPVADAGLAQSAAPDAVEEEGEGDAAGPAKRNRAAERRAAAVAALRQADRHLAGRRFGPAQNAYQQAVNLGRGASGYYGLGRVATAQSNPRKALGYYEKAVRASPRSASYHLALGNAYAATGNRTKASSEWRRVLDIDPNNRQAMQSLGIRTGSKTTKKGR